MTEMRLAPGQRLTYKQHAERLLRKHGYSRTHAGEIVRHLGLRLQQPMTYGELLEAATAAGTDLAIARREAERLSSITWTHNPALPRLASRYAEETNARRGALVALVAAGRSASAAYRLLQRHPEFITDPDSAPPPRRKRQLA